MRDLERMGVEFLPRLEQAVENGKTIVAAWSVRRGRTWDKEDLLHAKSLLEMFKYLGDDTPASETLTQTEGYDPSKAVHTFVYTDIYGASTTWQMQLPD